jgi:hypothetical protein
VRVCVGNFYTHEVGFTSMSDLTHINSKFSFVEKFEKFPLIYIYMSE